MDNLKVQKLKVGLHEAVEKWIEDEVDEGNWDAIDGYVGDKLTSLMVDAAFAVLMAQVDVNEYFKREDMLKL